MAVPDARAQDVDTSADATVLPAITVQAPPPLKKLAVCQNGVMDRVVHPVEPLAVRLTLAGAF
jgi:hypothetical protein